jgi:hypothetical protein
MESYIMESRDGFSARDPESMPEAPAGNISSEYSPPASWISSIFLGYPQYFLDIL